VEQAAATPTTARIFRELGERGWAFASYRPRARAWVERAYEQFVLLGLHATAGEVKAWLDAHPP
jgi:hypothetical protein